MREASARSRSMLTDDEPMYQRGRGKFAGALVGTLLGALARRPVDAIGALVAFALVTMIVVNALHLQAGPHPSPLMTAGSPARETTGSLTLVPEARPAPQAAAAPVRADTARTRAQMISELQRELARRGFYDGTVDGIHGPKMDAAIREFEQAAGRRQTGEASEALLEAVKRSTVKAERAKPTPRRADAGAPAPAPSRRIAAVQRALSDYGYGPLKLSGVVDDPTKAAIEKFERDRKLPVKGQVSDRMLRELAAVTGRPFE